jgi:Tfp pilus assembly protein PilW
MTGLLDTLRRRLGDDSGITLVEMLVASGISLAVLGMTVPFLTATMRDEPQVTGEALNISTGRVAVERIIREVRQGIEVTTSTSTQLSLETYTRHATCGSTTILPSGSAPIACQVTYRCSGQTCTRTEANVGVTTGTEVTLISGLADSSVFSYTPSSGTPLHVTVEFVIPDPDGAGNLTLEDGASLRNALLTG